jgi:hypothetical protein
MARYEFVSNCCGARPKNWGDNDSADFGICSECKEHCEYGYNNQYGDFFKTESEAVESDIANERDLLNT